MTNIENTLEGAARYLEAEATQHPGSNLELFLLSMASELRHHAPQWSPEWPTEFEALEAAINGSHGAPQGLEETP